MLASWIVFEVSNGEHWRTWNTWRTGEQHSSNVHQFTVYLCKTKWFVWVDLGFGKRVFDCFESTFIRTIENTLNRDIN